MNTHGPIVADDRKFVAPLNENQIGSCYVVFHDLVQGDHVLAGSQPGLLPYVRKTRGSEIAEAVMAEDVKVHTTVQLANDLKLYPY